MFLMTMRLALMPRLAARSAINASCSATWSGCPASSTVLLTPDIFSVVFGWTLARRLVPLEFEGGGTGGRAHRLPLSRELFVYTSMSVFVNPFGHGPQR